MVGQRIILLYFVCLRQDFFFARASKSIASGDHQKNKKKDFNVDVIALRVFLRGKQSKMRLPFAECR